jgi:hypothetical protein
VDPLSYRHRIVSGSNPENYIEETKLTILFAVLFNFGFRGNARMFLLVTCSA